MESTALSTTTTTNLLERRLLRELRDALDAAYLEYADTAEEWLFHDYIPWEQGRTFVFLGGEEWEPSRAKLAEPLAYAMDLLLLDKDNLPSYNRVLTEHLHLREGWDRWIGLWTAEEAVHAIALRDYLVVTGATDPVVLEQRRLAHMCQGVGYLGETPLQTLVFGALHERIVLDLLRAMIAISDEEPVLKQLLKAIAADEQRHSDFLAKVVRRGIEVAPDQMVLAVAAHLHEEGGRVLGGNIADYERQLAVIAKAGVHSEATQRATVTAALREWGILDLEDGLSEPARRAALTLREYIAGN